MPANVHFDRYCKLYHEQNQHMLHVSSLSTNMCLMYHHSEPTLHVSSFSTNIRFMYHHSVPTYASCITIQYQYMLHVPPFSTNIHASCIIITIVHLPGRAQRRDSLPRVVDVNVGVLQQRLHDVQVALLAGHEQRCQTSVFHSIDLNPGTRQQQHHHVHVSLYAGEIQRGGAFVLGLVDEKAGSDQHSHHTHMACCREEILSRRKN